MKEQEFKSFMSAHLVKGDKDKFFYNDDLGQLPNTLDSAFCTGWIHKINSLIKREKTAIAIYGDILHIDIPVFKPGTNLDKFENVTEDYKKILNRYLKTGIISDKRGGILYRILTKVDLFAFNGIFAFVGKKDVEFLEVSDTQIEADIGGDLVVFGLDIDKRYPNLMLLVKEVMQGYWDVRDHYLADKADKGNKSFIQKKYNIGEDVHIVVNGQEVISVEQTPTKYRGVKENTGWYVLDMTKVHEDSEGKMHYKPGYKTNAIGFTPYKIYKDKDGNTHYELIGAYTHILRDMMKFKSLSWQFKFLMNFNRINFVAGCRRAGKCISPLSRVRLSDGTFKLAGDLVEGDRLLASDKKSFTTIQKKEVYNKDIYRITLDNGMVKEVTGDHRIPTQKTFSKNGWDNNIDNYTTAENLKIGKDFIPTMFNIGNNKETNEQEYYESLLIGYILGDGCKQGGIKGSTHSCIAVYNDILLDKIISYVEKIGFKYYYNPEKNLLSIIDGGYLKKKYKGLNELSYDKYIDNSIFGMGSKFKWGIVDGLINTDGSIMFKKNKINKDGYSRKGNVLIEYCSTSKQLATDYQLLLSDLGIISYLRKKKIRSQFNKTNEYAYYVYITDKDSLIKLFNNCNLKGKKNFNKCDLFIRNYALVSNNTIGLIPKDAGNESKLTSRKNIRPRYNFQRRKLKQHGLDHWGEYNWGKVVNVEYIEKGEVIDIEVDGDSLYWVDGILTHNTLLSAYMVIRELWRMPFSQKHIGRTIKAVYIAPTEDKYKEVLDYIAEMSDRVKIMKIMEYVDKTGRLILKDEIVNDRGQKTIKNVAICDFVTARGFEPARGKASDFVVIDEAAFVGEDVWLNILPIIETEGAAFYGISTIDWNSSRNWFYESLVDYERGYDAEGYGMRVTIDDIDSWLVTDIQKERMKRALKHNPQRYYAELYATFPDMKSVFNTEGFFRVNSELAHNERITEIIIGYDPAKRTDVGGLIVAEVRNNSYINIIKEYALDGEYTTKQKPFIEEIKNKYSAKYPTNLIMDATAVGDVVAEIFGGLVDYKVWYTAKGGRPTVDDYGVWKVPKSTLVHMTQILMEKNFLKADISLIKLMDEIKNFKSFTTNAGNVKYEAESGHDDFVNAMMLVAFYHGHVNGKINEIGSDWRDQQIRDGIDPSTGLYKSYSVRDMSHHLPKGGDDGFTFFI